MIFTKESVDNRTPNRYDLCVSERHRRGNGKPESATNPQPAKAGREDRVPENKPPVQWAIYGGPKWGYRCDAQYLTDAAAADERDYEARKRRKAFRIV